MSASNPQSLATSEHASSSLDGTAESTPVYQSRLRAKREERMQLRQRPQGSEPAELIGVRDNDTPPASRPATSGHDVGFDISKQLQDQAITSRTTARSTTDELRKRQRGDARRALIDYAGTVWDAVKTGDLAMLHNFFLVQDVQKLVYGHTKDPEEFGRTLLHTAAWWGREEAASFVLEQGAVVDAIDTMTTRRTPLMDAARRGHAALCVLLIRHGSDPTLRDSSGDNAFHWAARGCHGECLLRMSLAIDEFALPHVWTVTNIRGKTAADYIRSHTTIFPMISKRLGGRVALDHTDRRHSRLTSRTATTASTSSNLEGSDDSRPTSTVAAQPHVNGVDTLGIDVGSFAYKRKESSRSIPSH